MGPVDPAVSASRSITAALLLVVTLTIAVCVTILILLGHNQNDLLRSARRASEYHLASTVRAQGIEHHMREVGHRMSWPSEPGPASESVRTLATLRRMQHLVEREMRALQTAQQQYADPAFEAPLRRLLEQNRRFAGEIAVLGDVRSADPKPILDRLDHFRTRLDQFRGLHWRAYLASDTTAARATGWRRFLAMSIMVSVAGLVPIGIATRLIITRVRERRRVERRQRMLLTELDHRVKNNLAAVLSMADQTVHSSSSLEEFAAAFAGRIVAMARTHEALAGSKWSGVDLTEAACMTLGAYIDAAPARITIDGDRVLLPADAAMPVCLVLHELSTNAAKHGALSTPGGRVSLSWTRRGPGVDLLWTEHGGPAAIEPESPGLGIQLIEGFVRHELRGDVAVAFEPEGIAWRIVVPLDIDASRSARTIEVKPQRRKTGLTREPSPSPPVVRTSG